MPTLSQSLRTYYKSDGQYYISLIPMQAVGVRGTGEPGLSVHVLT